MATFKLLVYDDTYEYPLWVNYLGIAGLAGSVVVALPIGAVVRLLSTGGSLKKVNITPTNSIGNAKNIMRT